MQFPSSTAMPVDPMSTFEDAEPASADKRTSESRAPVVDEKDESILYITLTLKEYQRVGSKHAVRKTGNAR